MNGISNKIILVYINSSYDANMLYNSGGTLKSTTNSVPVNFEIVDIIWKKIFFHTI